MMDEILKNKKPVVIVFIKFMFDGDIRIVVSTSYTPILCLELMFPYERIFGRKAEYSDKLIRDEMGSRI